MPRTRRRATSCSPAIPLELAGRFLRDTLAFARRLAGQSKRCKSQQDLPGDPNSSTRAAAPRIRSSRGGGGMRYGQTFTAGAGHGVGSRDTDHPGQCGRALLPGRCVTESREIDDAPYVVGFPDGRLLAGTGGTIFVRSILNAESDRYEVLRPGKEYRDPETNRVLGFEAAYVGTARIERLGDPATLTVTRSQRQVAIGDRVRPARDDEPIRSFFPRPAPAGLRGNIISVLNGVSQIGQYDVVVLSRGARKGVEVGHVFEVYRGGELRRDPVRNKRTAWNWRNETPLDTSFWYGDWELDGWNRDKPDPDAPLPLHRRAVRMDDTYIVPDSRSGVVMVFRVFPEVSFALVMSATQAMHVGEIVAPPRDL